MIYYDIDYNEEHQNLECDTLDDAKQWAQQVFAERCESAGLKFGESQAEVVTMKLDNNAEPHEIGREEFVLKYEAEDSQLSQHDTRGR